MLDIRWIRDNPEALDAALKKRGAEPESASLIKLDEERRAHIARVQEAQTRRNAASKEIGAAMGAGETEKAELLKAEVGELKAFLAAAEDVERELDARLRDALARAEVEITGLGSAGGPACRVALRLRRAPPAAPSVIV